LVYREPHRSENTGIRTSVDTGSTLLNDVGQSTSVVLAGVSQQCGGGVRSTALICTTVYSCSSFDTTHVVWSAGYHNATGSSMSGELPVCRGASQLGRVSPISTVCSTLLGLESGSMLSESLAQPRVTAVNSSSSRSLVASGSNSGELSCEDAKRKDGRDSAASGSYCSLLLDGVTGQPFAGPVPSVEDWMFERRHSREVRGSPYVRREGAAFPWFDRSPGRPLYGHFRSVDGPYWSSDGQNRLPIVQHRSNGGHLDGQYRSMDGHFAGPLDGPYTGQGTRYGWTATV